jgi:hypothetical protein
MEQGRARPKPEHAPMSDLGPRSAFDHGQVGPLQSPLQLPVEPLQLQA